jgi:hypothetical protein
VTVRQRHEVPLTEKDIRGALEYLRAGEIEERKQREIPGYVPSEDELPFESKGEPPVDFSKYQHPSESTGDTQVGHEPLTQELSEPPPTQNEPPDERPLDKEYIAELMASLKERGMLNEPPHEHSLEQGKEHNINIYNNISNSSEKISKEEIELPFWLDDEEFGEWKYKVYALLESDPERAQQLEKSCYWFLRQKDDLLSYEFFNTFMEKEFLHCHDCFYVSETDSWDEEPCWRCTYNPHRRESVNPENFYIHNDEMFAQLKAEREKELRKNAGQDIKEMDLFGNLKRTEESYLCLGKYHCKHAELYSSDASKNTICRYHLDEYGAKMTDNLSKCPIGFWEAKDKKLIIEEADR